jgi:hypothetical protein
MRHPKRALSRATAAAFALFTALGAASAQGAPTDADVARGACEAGLKIAGDAPISAATAQACHQAFLATQGPRDLRNKVAALLAEKPRPDLDVIAISALMADAARKQAPDQPWGTLARLDIARHLRRADLLETTRGDLQAFAATNEVVRAALSEDRIGRPSIGVWILRLLVLLGLAGTGLHALRNRNRSRPDGSKNVTLPSQPAAALLVLVSLLLASSATAAPTVMPDMKDGQLSRFKIDDDHPEAAVQKALEGGNDPLQLGYLLQDLSARVAAADAKHDHVAAARYYHAIALAAPTAFGPRKECEAREASGDLPGAINACRETLTRDGATVGDHNRFVELVLKNPNPPAQEPKELENVIAHLEKEPKAGNLATVLRCKVAMRFEDRDGIEKCKAALALAPSNDPSVISLKWGLAVSEHDKASALALVEEARKAGVDSQTVEKMLQTTNAKAMSSFRRAPVVGLAVLCAAALFLGARLLASRRRGATRSAA